MEFLHGIKLNLKAILNVFFDIRFVDILDIIVVAFIIYSAINLVRRTRAEQLVRGILLLLVFYGLAAVLDMQMITFLMQDIVFPSGLFALVVLFQPELRRALELVGRSKLGISSVFSKQEDIWAAPIDGICRAANSMHDSKTGALIVIERSTGLSEVVNTGTVIDAQVSKNLLCSLFFPNSALHDGAVIIRSGRVHAAGCILPLTGNANLDSELGTRHRAALGVSENSDAIVVIVSEETGIISVAMDGQITRNYNLASLHALLESELFSGEDDDGKKKPFWKAWKK